MKLKNKILLEDTIINTGVNNNLSKYRPIPHNPYRRIGCANFVYQSDLAGIDLRWLQSIPISKII